MKELFARYLGNDQTTIAGIVGIVALIASKFLPEFQNELVTFGTAALGVGLIAAKDADTGSKPGSPPTTGG